jgi:molybdopterin molybdotransferase
VLAACPPFHPSAVPLEDALGLVASVDVVAEEAIPPFENSAMDGYAVQAADTPGRLRVVGSIAAGEDPAGVVVGPGEAVRIMTGAAVPSGADAVVLVERTRTEGDEVEIEIGVEPGTAVRTVGDDVQKGDVVLRAGSVITPGRLGVLASLGVRRAPVRRRPRVGVLSTGDELVTGSEPLRPGQIRDSNRPTLLALLREAGAEAVDLGCAPDDEAAITDAIQAGTSACDAVLTSGGVSMGDYDLVKVVLDRIGEMRWLQLALRPAKPFAFGVVGGTPVFGLPGNPVSSMVSFELLARPALRQMLGFPPDQLDRPRASAVADEPLRRTPDGKLHVVRVVRSMGADGRYHVRSAGGQGSHQLSAMAVATGLALVPDGDGVAAGGDVEVLLL